MKRTLKPIEWHPDAKKCLLELPEAVRKEFGHELYLIQLGEMPENVSPFEGAQGSDILKLVERYHTNTYRCVFAAKLETAIYVLDVYMKKSTEGSKTPKHIIERVHARFEAAKQQDAEARAAALSAAAQKPDRKEKK